MKCITAALLVALTAAYVIATPTNALPCDDVDLNMEPCKFFLTKAPNGALKKALNAPNPSCCLGVAQLLTLSYHTNERQLVCSCVQQVASRISGFNDEAAANLAAACGTPLPFSIASGFNCDGIQ